MPTPDDVNDLLGGDDQLSAALSVVTAMAKSYCRKDWDELPADVAAVVKLAALRLLAHPQQLDMAQTMGVMSMDWREGFSGFTIGELFVLNRYRVRAV
ncbi:hypothetical protein PDG61_19200 [Mycolicibacterium sp. BiH015]|uniref:hypothetical protein n=1 Tax=Mycolicibacterium sp. BiH015 TaxID=3018808 RepID=UPI0022E08805|nr:hypothetical protein [Mycolicibacterium sp. BiH015]MDA2893057.1 hypothetical protein [Mycolicibacterium sp. BiH015]